MATDISVTKTQTTSVVVFTGNEETCQNLLSIIQRSGHGTELADIRTHVVSVLKSDLYDTGDKVIFARSLQRWMIKKKHLINVGKLI